MKLFNKHLNPKIVRIEVAFFNKRVAKIYLKLLINY